LSTIIPAAGDQPASFSGAITRPPDSVVIVEVSIDLGQSDPREEISRVTLDGSGSGAVSNAADPGSIGVAADFLRLKLAP
jgi:hypothetical protein